MSEHFSVVTANTYAGQLLLDHKGLEPFRRAATDVLLFQEVLHLPSGWLEGKVESEGYGLAAHDAPSGLAIAVRQASKFRVVEGSARVYSLRTPGLLGRAALRHELPAAQRLRSRAAVAVALETNSGVQLSVMTTHPIVFARPLARRQQLDTLATIIQDNYHAEGNLILGGDMNHYPRPGKPDDLFARRTNLTRANIVQPTWPVSGSKHAWLAHVAKTFTGNPLEHYDGQLDSILYRGQGLSLSSVSVDSMESSDHHAITGHFEVT